MRQYITGKAGLTRLLTVVLTTSLLTVLSCADELEKTDANHNLTLSTRAGETAAQQIPSMRLFNFNHGGSDDKKFYQEVLNVTRSTDKLTAQVEVGQWNMALVSNPNGGTIIKPVANKVISQLPLYKYEPTYANGVKTTDAHEMYLDNQLTPNITSGGSHSMNAQLNRTVARVDLIIKKTTPNFNLSGTHKIKLHNVPSTISYTGDLLPNAAAPDTLNRALEAPVKLVNANDGSYKGSDTITFIIPAHRGDAYKSASPTDVVGVKMDVTLNLERTGGTRFAKQEQIQIVAQCNKILRVEITVNDGITFDTSIQDWEGVGVNSNVGKGYQNWLYVKKGATGNGLSWSDALPDINTAIEKAVALKATKTVHGILVAGGSQYIYDGLSVPAGIRVFGGWKGDPGTELSNNVNEVYTSPNRNLKDYKVIVDLGATTVNVADAGAVMDGFVVQNANASNTNIVSVSNGGWINAVEIKNNPITSGNVLTLSNGIASNILVSGNNRSIAVSNNGKLINATVVENNNVESNFTNGAIYNSIFWPEKVTLNGTNDIQSSAFVGEIQTIPSGTGNIHIHSTNNAWFSSGITAPGPHFKLTNDSERYKALSNRTPMLGRGNEALYTTNLGAVLDKDINGNKRYDIDPQDNNKKLMDIGCYEDQSGLIGFRLTWAADRLYISAKGGYSNNLPLMLPGNANPETEIDVDWQVVVTALPGTIAWSTYEGAIVNTTDKVVVGTLKFKNIGETPENDYEGSSDRQWGTVTISTNLGGYLPNTNVEIWQLPGVKSLWTNGYVGSFHRNGERGARYISGPNTTASTYWEARIISGLEWIKIDKKGKDDGANITDPEEGKTPLGGYYKEVEESWGGVIEPTRGAIKFRVGMKSKNTGKPRYGLIVITRGTLDEATKHVTGSTTMFFVRQGEEPDVIYTEDDSRRIGGVEKGRLAKYMTPFTVYNLTAPVGTTNTNNGVDISRTSTTKATFVKYPTQIGYYFRYNTTIGYPYGSTTAMTNTFRNSYSPTYEVCPVGYRHPMQEEYMYTVYDRATVIPASNPSHKGWIEPSVKDSQNNYMLGAYADGYYDQLATDPVAASNTAPASYLYNGVTSANAVNEKTPGAKGMLMVSHFNYASVFFPISGTLSASGGINNPTYAMYAAWLDIADTASFPQYLLRNTHWGPENSAGHIGMNCTGISSRPAPVRCVVDK